MDFYHGFLRQCFKLAFYHKNWNRYFTQIYHRLTRKRQRATRTLPQESPGLFMTNCRETELALPNIDTNFKVHIFHFRFNSSG